MPKNKTKTSSLFFSASLAGLLLAPPALAAIVPCGGYSTADTGMCTLCHLIVGIKNIFNYAFLIFVGVALLMMVVAGIIYITSAGNTTMMESAKKLMKNVLAGFALVLLAWLIVNYTMIILSTRTNLGVNEATNWYTFTCNTTSAQASNPDNTNPDNTNPDNTNPDNTNPDNTNPDSTTPCTDFTYSDWSTCTNGSQYRVIRSYIPPNCTGGTPPVLTQICTVPGTPACVSFAYSAWGTCQNNQQTRTVRSSSPTGCTGGNPVLTQACTASTCASFTYSAWSTCRNNQQSRTVRSSSPTGCTGGNPVLTQNCGGTVITGVTGTPITNAIPLVLNGYGQNWPGIPMAAGEPRYYKVTIPAGNNYLGVFLANYDQNCGANAILEKGEAIDYFDAVYQHYVSTGNFLEYYTATYNNTQVWTEMTSAAGTGEASSGNARIYGKWGPPAAGTYYIVVEAPCFCHISIAVRSSYVIPH